VLGAYHRYDPEAGLDALACTHAAVTCFMDSRSFSESVIRAVRLGGDTDTAGAITGALAGSLYGIGQLPVFWLSELEDAGMLVSLGCSLWNASVSSKVF
jgi:ADP-ribosyl-[dinitrogen reductase] hydrolase